MSARVKNSHRLLPEDNYIYRRIAYELPSYGYEHNNELQLGILAWAPSKYGAFKQTESVAD